MSLISDGEGEGNSSYPDWKGALKLSFYLVVLHLLAGMIMGFIWDYISPAFPPLWFTGLGGMIANIFVIRYAMSRGDLNPAGRLGVMIGDLTAYLATIILVFSASIIFSQAVNVLRVFVEAEFYQEIVQAMREENILMIMIVLVILPALLEEIIFRGIIMRGLIYNHGFKFALLFSSLLFSLVHFNLIQGFSAFFMGLVLGWLYWRYNSLLIPIIAHGFNNFLAVIFNRRFYIPGYSFAEEVVFQPLGFTLLGIVLFILGIYLVYRNSRMV